MTSHELDNPIWESLISRHRWISQRDGDIRRYPGAIAPFLGVVAEGVDAGAALELLVPPGDSVYLLGPIPAVSENWSLQGLAQLAQMICTAPIPVIDGPEVIELTEAHRVDVLALTALVYPHYFRPRAMELGRYFGIYEPDKNGNVRLAAMIGERLGTEAFQEMSAICTHPDFLGRGYARRLTALLTNDTLEHGRTPFLHVSHENHRAKALYEQLGYRHRRDIGFWSLRKMESEALP